MASGFLAGVSFGKRDESSIPERIAIMLLKNLLLSNIQYVNLLSEKKKIALSLRARRVRQSQEIPRFACTPSGAALCLE